MRASVCLRLPDGSVDHLAPGDIIGRVWSAALRLDDPHVSEAHALVSLRGRSLRLLALRGRFLVDGQAASETELLPGPRLRFSPETELTVLSVELPEQVMGIEGDSLPPQILAGTCSLSLWPHPRLSPGSLANADAILWSTGDGWRLRIQGEPAQPFNPGDRFTIGNRSFSAVAMTLSSAGQDRTQQGVDAPLHLIGRYDSVHIHRAEGPPLVLSGQAARVVSELISVGAPLSWEALAQPLWPELDDRDALRRRWDICLVRLRARLRDAGIRPDLVRSSRLGLVELVLQAGDRVEDQS